MIDTITADTYCISSRLSVAVIRSASNSSATVVPGVSTFPLNTPPATPTSLGVSLKRSLVNEDESSGLGAEWWSGVDDSDLNSIKEELSSSSSSSEDPSSL